MVGATVKVAQRHLRSKLECSKEKVWCGAHCLKNVFVFRYLGHHFQADGDWRHAVEVRMGQARSRFGDLHHIWSSKALSLELKLSLYVSGVCSMLVHGGEAWLLTRDVVKSLRGWNARCLHIITGRHWRDETRDPTVNLIGHLRARRVRWLGHVLRMDESRLLHRMVCESSQPYPEGSIFEGVPPHESMEVLKKMAANRKRWSAVVRRERKKTE